LNNLKAIIFDFDGVIVESVDIKTNAFAELYRPYGEEVVKKIINHNIAHGGISRYVKFRLYHKEFLGITLSDSKISDLSKKYTKLVLSKVVEAPYVNGAYDFISKNYRNYDFYISTGTPIGEIITILNRRGLDKFFTEVYGSPETKNTHVKEIMSKYNYSKDEVVFIGDALTDRDAARKNGIEFIARDTALKKLKDEKYLFNDFIELELIINTLNHE